MKSATDLLRSRMLPLAVFICAIAATAPAQADNWPSKRIIFIVPAGAGGTNDITARMFAEPLSKSLGQPIVVENRAGGNGGIAATAVTRAEPDGYTFLIQYSGFHVITPSIAPQKWDPVKDFTPVATLLFAPQVIVARNKLPANSLGELISYARANPGKLNFGSTGIGSLNHVTGELINQYADVKMAHIPYKSTATLFNDMMGDVVDVTFVNPPSVLGFINNGGMKALAVTGKSRVAVLPRVPTSAEAGFPKLDPSSWFAIFAPPNTPAHVVQRMSAEIRKLAEQPEFKRRAEEQGAEAIYMGPDQLKELVESDLKRWGEIIKAANIKLE